ncbi:hypothetical protein [Orrella sp. 11846]|uniref:hypothetical protein n=1 Tax=Orrella sp. 11846 TaxID=3409913 RepID=UPI003B593F96
MAIKPDEQTHPSRMSGKERAREVARILVGCMARHRREEATDTPVRLGLMDETSVHTNSYQNKELI